MRNTGDKCGGCGMLECECKEVRLNSLNLTPKNRRRLEKKIGKGASSREPEED